MTFNILEVLWCDFRCFTVYDLYYRFYGTIHNRFFMAYDL